MTTVAVLASGPSMNAVDVQTVRDAGIRAIVINDTFRLMPDAAALFAADACWWQANPDAEHFAGEKYVSEDQRIACATYVRPELPKHGGNSAMRAVQMAYRQGARRILLLGVDLQDHAPTHWHGLHADSRCLNPTPETFARARRAWTMYAESYDRPEIINCSPDTALTCFRKMPVRFAIAEAAMA